MIEVLKNKKLIIELNNLTNQKNYGSLHIILRGRGKKMTDFKEYIKKSLVSVSKSLGNINIVRPPKSDMGDYAVGCFTLNINGIEKPNDKANYLKSQLNIDPNYISRVSVIGPYLNFTINREKLAAETIKYILEEQEKYGSSKSGIGKDLLIEHTSINPNASPHIGRSRNSIIGNFLVNLYKFEGYNVDVHYFINDIGKQIAMLLIGIEEKNNLSSVTFEDMLSIYIEISEKSKVDPDIEKKVFEYLYQLENGNENVRDKFRKITDICVEGQRRVFNKINIRWDIFTHESDFVFDSRTSEVLDKLKKTGRLKEDESGRYYVDLTGYNIPTKSPVLILTREDKTSLYPLRDIAYTIHKISLNSDNNFIVLGEDQEVYMKQISAVLDILGYKSPELISYSFVLLNGDKMATREGKVVLLEDFIEEAQNKIVASFEERHVELDSEKTISLAASCIKYNILNVNRKRNVNFNLDEATNFQGNSAMYLLYNYARICTILDKAGDEDINTSYVEFKEDLEYLLISSLYDFPEVISNAVSSYEAVVIANYLYEISQKFSKYYEMIPILLEDDSIVKNSRIALLRCTKIVLENGMRILGIEPIRKLWYTKTFRKMCIFYKNKI